jgi:hypothetical protein
MSALNELSELIGKWQGTNHLWLSPDHPVRKSDSGAEIRTIAQGQFTEIQYAWAFDGERQEGRIILGQPSKDSDVKAVWFDTWHMMNQFMLCDGNVYEKGVVSLKGTYAAPTGPDWGWQITIEPQGKDSFQLFMHNITPGGEKFLAVEIRYSRSM